MGAVNYRACDSCALAFYLMRLKLKVWLVCANTAPVADSRADVTASELDYEFNKV